MDLNKVTKKICYRGDFILSVQSPVGGGVVVESPKVSCGDRKKKKQYFEPILVTMNPYIYLTSLRLA